MWVLEYVANDADRSGLLPFFICSAAGTRSQPASQLRMWVLVDGSEQGDAGMSGYLKPGHPLGNSLHMLYVMPRRLGTHRSAWIAQERTRSQLRFTPPPSVVRNERWQGGEGISGYHKPAHPLGNSIHMLHVMPRRLITHCSAWIAQEQGFSSDLRHRQVSAEFGAEGWRPKRASYGEARGQ